MKLSSLSFLLVLSVAFVYQLCCLPLYTFDGVGPDFVLAALIALGLYGRSPTALWAAVLSGGVNDALSMHPWGTHALGYVVVLWFVVRMRTKIDGADRYATLLVVILAASLNEAISCSVLFIEGGRAALVGWEWTLMTVGYKSALAFVVTALIKPFRHALAGRRLGALYRF